MPITQREKMAPPRPEDKETLDDYSSIIQDNLGDLFQAAHNHTLRTTVPASNEGNVGDIFLVETSTTFKLYVKFTTGWKSVTLS